MTWEPWQKGRNWLYVLTSEMMSKITELGYGRVRVAVKVWFWVNGLGRKVRFCCWSRPEVERSEALVRNAARHGWRVCLAADCTIALEMGVMAFILMVV